LTPDETGIAIPFFSLYRWIIRKTDGPAPCPEIGAEDNGAATAGQLALLSVTWVATVLCNRRTCNFADLAGRARPR
jgi:hypothetical protein